MARRLLSLSEQHAAETRPGAIQIKGSEGMAVQFADCCHPIPGDPIIGFINKGQGLVIHTHDCPSARRSRSDSDKWIDVEWSQSLEKSFEVRLRVSVLDQRGVLAKVAAAIAEAGSDIANISVENDGSLYATNQFTLQVSNRQHLARVMRALRRVPEVVRIARTGD